MPLQILTDVKDALDNDKPLKASDIRALVATTEMLWRQIVESKRQRDAAVNRRDYMCAYMRQYRKRKREDAAAAMAGGSEIH
jgi:hypothetical protein